MITIVLSIIVLSFFVPLLHRLLENKTALVLSLVPLTTFAWFFLQYLNGAFTKPQTESWEWNPLFDLNLSFYLDGLSLLFALLISGIGFLIFIYGNYYMKNAAQYGRFFMVLMLFMASMLGLVLADNWLTILIFWEMTSIASFLLIGYENESKQARSAAWQSLLVTASGGLALLAGMILIIVITGEYQISELWQHHELITGHKLYLPILLCVSLGAFTKSAQVPFHFWLPNAMAAPTPVSAYLHSATMVKAGVYFFARFSPILGNTPQWQILLSVVGTITAVTGAVMAFRSDNLKKLLAYSTISALGMMVLSFGIGTKAAVYAGTAYIIAHALYKSSLFMVTGIVDKQTGTKKLSELPLKLYKKIPLAFGITLLAALSLAGIAPFFGFVSKEMLLKMTIESPIYSTVFTVAMVLVGSFFVAILLILSHKAFFKKREEDNESDRSVKPVSKLFYLPPTLAALAGLFFGLFPDLLSTITSSASVDINTNAGIKHLALWHGFNTPFLLSLISVSVGVALYYYQRKTAFKLSSYNISWLYPSTIYDRSVNGLLKFASWHTRTMQTGYLRYYAMFTLLAILLVVGFTFFYKSGIRVDTSNLNVYVFEIVLAIIAVVALGYPLFTKSKIGSLLALSIVGIAISIIFMEAGAPDLAITFFLIDTLTITIFVLILNKLPRKLIPKKRITRFRDTFIAVGFGVLITLILFAITSTTLDSKLKEFYAENSYELARGKNIVNVILVDFRVLDTLGEITVLAIAALGVFALVNFSKEKKRL